MIIQGGMGVGVSNWLLARTVAATGQLGVVSGTALDNLFVRRLQAGDLGGHMRRAMEKFPIQSVVDEVLKRYFVEGGKGDEEAYKPLPMYRQMVSRVVDQLTVLSNFVEVTLAKEGHEGVVGINLLTKVQMPNLASLYGAMLAGVDYVLMGAGIPKEIPGALDRLALHEPATLKLDVEGDRTGSAEMVFDPAVHWDGAVPEPLKRPYFFPIIASNSLATMLVRKATGRIDGFVIEGPTAGGHNAPPRGEMKFNGRGEPEYGERDAVDLEKMRELGLPFWLAGSTGGPDQVIEALDAGAAGVQVGTLFAYCDESGLRKDLKKRVLSDALAGKMDVYTDLRASPTGFPFKIVQIGETVASQENYEKRERVCDLGYLRHVYRMDNGRLGYRCPAEPVDTYVKKGGRIEDTVGRKCLCNALMADVGHGQRRDDGREELPLVTSGDDLLNIGRFARSADGYSAVEVIDYLRSGLRARAARHGGHAAAAMI
jgi:nitronate monooxygenase